MRIEFDHDVERTKADAVRFPFQVFEGDNVVAFGAVLTTGPMVNLEFRRSEKSKVHDAVRLAGVDEVRRMLDAGKRDGLGDLEVNPQTVRRALEADDGVGADGSVDLGEG